MASNRVPPAGATSATTSSAGIVQLTDSTSSTSTTTAATPNAVKSAYDLANGAIAKTLTTTTGDIIYASGANTPARLGIGSTDQVLKVSGGIPSWGAASNTLVKIERRTFSATNQITFDSIFTNTYHAYMFIFEEIVSAYPYSGLMKFNWRKNAANITGNGCNSFRVYIQATNSTAWTFDGYGGQNNSVLFNNDNRPGNGVVYFYPRNTSSNRHPSYHGTATQGAQVGMPAIFSGLLTNYDADIDGIQINTTSNMTGAITIYGVAL